MKSKYETMKVIYYRSKLDWYWAPVFVAFWFLLFYIVVIHSFNNFPENIMIAEEMNNTDRFIGERAENLLMRLSKIGPKVVGSPANEQSAVQFLLNELSKIREDARHDIYIIQEDVQIASGNYVLWEMVNIYQSIQNVVVKVTPRNSESTSSILLNSHYDTVPGSSGAGDSGLMIAVMLETLRVITKRETNLKHSIVFLFNGAEENPLQGSHAFITQHEWAANVKAVINLDSAGSGGREILFQSGPGHPWLMKYYGAHIVHPYASTIAEELFQNGFVPSETDYRIFRDFGHIPGLDMAHSFNGFVYHTKYDRFTTIPRRTYQRTGDNVLALTKALANAVELEDPSVNLLSLVRKSKTILSCFGIIWIIFMGIAASPMGFPYVEKEAPQRFYAVHSSRTFHDDSPAMVVKYEDFGFYVVPVDRRPQSIDFMFQETNFTKSDANFCETEIMCGFPIYSSRWLEWRNQSFWVEASQPTKIGWATLKIISKEQTSSKTILFTLEVAGPHHISIFIQPMHGVKLMDWSFTKIPLEQNFTAPYYLYFSYALDPTPLRFHLEFKWETEDWSGSTFAIALIGHKVDDINTTDDFREFLTSFPAWAHVSAWTSSYESWKL
ncbi:hypothetical protein GQX74_013929 [Glossina fuscipes]|nr:hypothetical protein GQX74_013929 [Glossina fuscipes]